MREKMKYPEVFAREVYLKNRSEYQKSVQSVRIGPKII